MFHKSHLISLFSLVVSVSLLAASLVSFSGIRVAAQTSPAVGKYVAGPASNPSIKILADFGTQNGWTTQYQYPRGVADLTGDGYDDIYGFGYQGVWVSTNSTIPIPCGGGTTTNFAASQNVYAGFDTLGAYYNQDYVPRFVVDVDKDGLKDLASLDTFYPQYVLNAQDEGNTPLNFGIFDTEKDFFYPTAVPQVSSENIDKSVVSDPLYSDFNIAAGWTDMVKYPRVITNIDGNANNSPDIVGFGQDGVWTSIGQSVGKMWPSVKQLNDFGVNQGWTNSYLYPRTLADINGDTYPDIVGFGQDGVWVSLNNQQGGFNPSQRKLSDFSTNIGWSNSNQYPRYVVDINGDNYADIVGFGQDGVWVSQNNGQGGFLPSIKVLADFNVAGGWTTQYQYPRFIGDIDGDNYLDIVGFGIDGVWANRNFYAPYDQVSTFCSIPV